MKFRGLGVKFTKFDNFSIFDSKLKTLTTLLEYMYNFKSFPLILVIFRAEQYAQNFYDSMVQIENL